MRLDHSFEPAPRFEPLEARQLLSAPTASLTVDDVAFGGGKAHSFVVEYQSDAPIDLDTLDGLDILVTGPGGYAQNGRFMAVIDTGDPLAVRALYRIEAPGGKWDGPDNGAYDIALRAGQVANTNDETNAAAALGSFNVDADQPSLGADESGDLGELAGLTILNNLSNQIATPSQFTFRMTGTGTADHFIQLNSAAEESSINFTLYRQVNGRLRNVKDSSNKKSDADTQGGRNHRVGLKGVPAGTYIIRFNTINPHHTLTINPATAPTPDLAAVALTLSNTPDTLIPGDKFRGKVRMTNLGDGKLFGSVVVDLYLSADAVFDAGDVLAGTNAVRTVVAPFGYTRVFPNENRTTLKTNQSKTVTVKGKVPSNIEAGSYFIIAVVEATDLIPETDETNNAIASAAAKDVAFNFGTFDDRSGAVLQYLEQDDTAVTFRLSGPGFGQLTFNAGVASLTFLNTTSRTRVTISTKGGSNMWSIDDLTVADSIGSIFAPTVELLGTVDITGTIGEGQFKNLTLP